MDDRRFDDLSRVVATGASRRTVIKTMAGGLVAGVFGASRFTGALAQDGNCGQANGRDEGCPCQEDQPGSDPLCAVGLECVLNDSSAPGSEDSGICCPTGSTVVGGECVPPVVECPEPCPEGTTQQEDCSCVCDAVCPEGTTQQEDCSCVCDAVCPTGTTQQEDCSCVCDAVCPTGTTQQADCSCKCDQTCKDDEVQLGDCSCVPSTCPETCPTGTTQQEDCSCVCNNSCQTGETQQADCTCVAPTTPAPTTPTTTTTTTTALPATGIGSGSDGSDWLKPAAVVGVGAAFLASRLRRPAEGTDQS